MGSYFNFLLTGGVFGKLMPKQEYFSRALYTFDIGQNDIAAGYSSNMSKEQVRDFISDVLDQLSITIKVIKIPFF